MASAIIHEMTVTGKTQSRNHINNILWLGSDFYGLGNCLFPYCISRELYEDLLGLGVNGIEEEKHDLICLHNHLHKRIRIQMNIV